MHKHKRRLADGREVDVGNNDGIRKICACPRRNWGKCGHDVHGSYQYGGRLYRFSISRVLGRRVTSLTEGREAMDGIRRQIRAGEFGGALAASPADPPVPAPPPAGVLTFKGLAARWTEGHGHRLASAKIDPYRLKVIYAFPVPDSSPAMLLGDMPAAEIALRHIEAFRDHRKDGGLSTVAINHDLKLIRKIFNWAIRRGLVERTPFKIGTEPAIQLEREIPRHKRVTDEEERRLLDAADPHLKAVIIAMLETACRPGEILALQWQDVSLDRKEFVVRAEKSKTRSARLVPVSERLLAILHIRRHAPDGKELPGDAFVFGNAIGARVKSVRERWEDARETAGIDDLHLADLRHEAASRFDEAGLPINAVSTLLGHTNLTTTSRYLNLHRRGLHLAMAKFEEHRRLASGLQDPADDAHDPSTSKNSGEGRKSLTIQ